MIRAFNDFGTPAAQRAMFGGARPDDHVYEVWEHVVFGGVHASYSIAPHGLFGRVLYAYNRNEPIPNRWGLKRWD